MLSNEQFVKHPVLLALRYGTELLHFLHILLILSYHVLGSLSQESTQLLKSCLINSLSLHLTHLFSASFVKDPYSNEQFNKQAFLSLLIYKPFIHWRHIESFLHRMHSGKVSLHNIHYFLFISSKVPGSWLSQILTHPEKSLFTNCKPHD